MLKAQAKTFFSTLLLLGAMAGAAAAQYQPIPNFTGIGAGFNFRQAINQRLSGAQAVAPQFVGLPFASLPAERDGLLLWCKDCQATSPCGAGGAGAWATGARGAWACAAGALEQDLNANGHSVVAAASVKAQLPGDAQSRELMVPGGGIKVGNGTAAPFTVVDEGSNVNGHLNGVINVKAPPYLAKGDGATDDTAAIQAAINAACAAPGINKPEVYLPATPGGLFYYTSAPILINCSIRFEGAGRSQTWIKQNYFGPAIIAQEAETGWKPPLTTSVTRTWQPSTTYWHVDILDSNGNLEEQEGALPCTSGSGSHPSWPTTQPNTVTDNNCTWGLATTGGRLTIASGSGGSLDAGDGEFFNGAGYGSNNATLEIMNPSNLEPFLNCQASGCAAFTVEFYVEPFLNDGGSGNYQLIGIHGGLPANNADALKFTFGGSGCSNGYNCVSAGAYIGGSFVWANAGGTGTGLSINKIHHVALSYDGTTLRFYIDGALQGSHAASGVWTTLPFESFMLADNGPSEYPGQNSTTNILPAFYDSIRISNTARYTSTFTPPTAKFSMDSNTIFLENFPTNTPTGTIEGVVNTNGGVNVFIPVETSNGAADLNPVHIGNLELNDNGIWATWMLNSTVENISFPDDDAGRACINLWDNDFQDTIRNVGCGTVPAGVTRVGFLFMKQSNNNLYDHIQCDGQYACIGQVGGSGHYVDPDYTDRGRVYYPLYFIQAQAQIDSPWLDIEDGAPNQVASIYSNGAFAPIVINGGQLTDGASGNAYLAISGGAPFIVNGTDFAFGSPAELLNVIANPSSPVAIRDANVPPGLASTNAGKSWWLNESSGGQDLGVKFADLPGSVTNGVRRYCVDCDPPASPPVACTSAGTKTGAWVNGLNSTWVCVP